MIIIPGKWQKFTPFQELELPPTQVTAELYVQSDRVVSPSEVAQQVDHQVDEGAPWPHHLSCVM